jgi:peptidoglycan/LPS O-acetylase OafA/YrhL
LRKLNFLEGLRGLASLQVVWMHMVLCFWPTALYRTALFRVANDGGLAVCIFFLLSGTVLRFAFEPIPHLIAENLGRRAVRLGLPLLAACALAYCLRLCGHDAMHLMAARSPWIASQDQPLTGAGSLLDGTVWTILGYRNTTLLGPIAAYLPWVESSIDCPIWSLHVEFWGSVMMLAVVAASALGARWRWLVILGFALLCGVNPLVLFLAGYLVAPFARRDGSWPALGISLIGLGMAVSAFHFVPGLAGLAHLMNHVAVLRTAAFFDRPSLAAAMLIYLGVLLSGVARRVLSFAAFVWLGRMSFSIYLLHLPVLLSLGLVVAATAGPAAACVATIIATGMLAVVFERWVDRPATRLSHWFTKGSRPGAGARIGHAASSAQPI